MSQLERNLCAISGSKDLEHLYTFKNFPVFMGCSAEPAGEDLMADMSWWISRESGLIQLKNLIPLEILYTETHGAGSVGAIWDQHHKAFANFLHKNPPKSVLEIGGAHGRLEKAYQTFDQIPWTILEPNPSPVEGCNATFIRGFFDEKFKLDSNVEAVIHSHLFEHIYDPNVFMKHLSNFMKDGQQLIFSLPNMHVMLERKYNNCINFEHTLLLSEVYVDYLLAKFGFRVDIKEYFKEDHSIFYRAFRDKKVSPTALPSTLYKNNKKIYDDYIIYHENLIRELNQKMLDAEGPIYLFGAHIFAQYLIAFGLNTSLIASIIDNDKNKHGKRLSGTNLIVNSPEVLRNINSPMIILKAGVYNEEIKSQIIRDINIDAVFI